VGITCHNESVVVRSLLLHECQYCRYHVILMKDEDVMSLARAGIAANGQVLILPILVVTVLFLMFVGF